MFFFNNCVLCEKELKEKDDRHSLAVVFKGGVCTSLCCAECYNSKKIKKPKEE